MANLAKIRLKAELIGTLNPKAWDGVNPHEIPQINDYSIELLVADTLKDVAKEIKDKQLKTKSLDLSRQIASYAGKGFAEWEEGDDICPPWWPWGQKPFPPPHGPFPPYGPFPVPGPTPGPDPSPFNSSKFNLLDLSRITLELSAGTMVKEFNVALHGIAVTIAKSVSKEFGEMIEECGTVPRTPFRGVRRPPKPIDPRV